VIRLVATLVSAMLLSRPEMPRNEAERYARALNAEAKVHDFDPLLAVAIIHFESHWYPAMVSPDGEDYGLGQVRARFVGACREDEDPVGNPSEACKAAKASLLDPINNIRHMGSIIAANRELCEDKAGTLRASRWLAGYQGYNSPVRHRWCQPGDKTWRVLGYHKELVDTLVPHAKKAAPPAKPIAAAPPAKAPPPAKPAAAPPVAKAAPPIAKAAPPARTAKRQAPVTRSRTISPR
jgi:hypothetical protein